MNHKLLSRAGNQPAPDTAPHTARSNTASIQMPPTRYRWATGGLLPSRRNSYLLFLLVTLFLLNTRNGYGQGYTQNFDDISTLPASGWVIQNNSNPLGLTTWFQGTPSVFEAYNGATNAYIAVNYNSAGTSGSTISNWLITPNCILRNGDVFTFYTRKVLPNPSDFPDRLEVRMSTNGLSTDVGTTATSTGDFATLLLSVNPDLLPSVYPTTWTMYTITISGLSAPVSGRIAFRYFVTNGGPSPSTFSDYIGIDNVHYQPNCPTITVNPASLTGGTAGTSYSQSLSQTGTLGTTSYAITAGALPPGLTLSGSGTISGTPTATGTFNFTVTVADASGCSGSRAYSITTVCGANPINFPALADICANAAPITLSQATPGGGTYSGTGVSGGQFNPSAGSQTITYNYTDPYGCPHSANQGITVKNGGTATVIPDSQTVCSGGTLINIEPSGSEAGTTFTWTRNNTGSVTGLPANGSDTISGSLINTTAAPVIVSFIVTPNANGCTGTPDTAKVKVLPEPEITAVTNGAICSPGGIVDLSATGNGTIAWYDSLTAGTPLHVGPNYSPTVTANTTYYVESIITDGADVVTPANQTSTFPGNVRGYVFTAPVDFVITSLEVPTTASSGNQNIAVVRMNGNVLPPVFSGSTNAFTTLFLIQNSTASGKVPVFIPVHAGEVIGILGNRGNLNSYTPGDAVVNISGIPVTLRRLGMQFQMSSTAPRDLWHEFGPTTSISRINFDYALVACQSAPREPVTATLNPLPVLVTNDTTVYGTAMADLTAANITAGSESGLSLTYWSNSAATIAVPNPTSVGEGTYYIVAENSNGCKDTVDVVVTVIPYRTISGKVYHDADGLSGSPVNTINGTGTNAGNLKVVLVNNVNDSVIKVQPVMANGNFLIDEILDGDYRLILTTSAVTGYTPPSSTLAPGWVHTGEFLGAGAGNDGDPNGVLQLGVINDNIVNAKFGIQRPPIASNSSIAAQLNPGSNTTVNLPNSSFNMSDAAPGAVTQVRFTSFPAGTDNFYINGNSYNSGSWPGSVTVNAQYIFGNLIMPNIMIDPTTGPQQVLIRYQAIDAANAASDTATITMPFFGIEIGGMVHNNFQGMNGSPANTIAGPGTNGGGLFAILSDDISNTVVATQSVNGSTGAYQFTGIDQGYYTVLLSTTNATPGSTAPASSINSGWKATAEKNGTGAGNDGFADSKIYLGLQAANNNNVRFGIQQPPTASPATAASQLNPNGNINYTVPAATFVTMDAAPGAVTSLYFSGALPANANKLILNGVTYSATNPLPPAGVHVAVSGGSPVNPILVDPVNGNVTVAISYNAVDAAGMMSAATIASQPFHKTAALAGGSNNNDNGAAPANPEEQGFSAFRIIDINIYPNPAKDRVFVKINDYSLVKTLRLLDIHGRELRVSQQDIERGVDMGGLATGTYLLQVELQNGNSQRFKVVKE